MSQEKPVVQYEDFAKLDLRIAKVVEVADHPDADKLLVLKLDVGGKTQQTIAGIKGHYSPESLLGRELVVVTNLAPRKMRGLESQGMLLAATADQGGQMDVVIVGPDKQVPPGSPVS